MKTRQLIWNISVSQWSEPVTGDEMNNKTKLLSSNMMIIFIIYCYYFILYLFIYFLVSHLRHLCLWTCLIIHLLFYMMMRWACPWHWLVHSKRITFYDWLLADYLPNTVGMNWPVNHSEWQQQHPILWLTVSECWIWMLNKVLCVWTKPVGSLQTQRSLSPRSFGRRASRPPATSHSPRTRF